MQSQKIHSSKIAAMKEILSERGENGRVLDLVAEVYIGVVGNSRPGTGRFEAAGSMAGTFTLAGFQQAAKLAAMLHLERKRELVQREMDELESWKEDYVSFVRRNS